MRAWKAATTACLPSDNPPGNTRRTLRPPVLPTSSAAPSICRRATMSTISRSTYPVFAAPVRALRSACSLVPGIDHSRCGKSGPGEIMDSPWLLLVDDEPSLTELLKKYLERLGYRVDACTHPEAALALFDAHPERYAVL